MTEGLMEGVTLTLSGTTTVRNNGEVIAVTGTPNRTLLSILAMRAGEDCSNDRLVDWLWGSKMPANPKGALYTRISRLRDALGAARHMVVSADDGYRLDLSPSQIDVYAYQAAVSDDDRSLESMLTADRLWRGRPFVGVAGRDVIEDEADRLTQVWLVARHELVERLIEAARFDEAVRICESTLREEPFDEPTMALLLRLAVFGQRPRETPSRYEQWRQRYVDSFGTTPPAYLDELAEHLQPDVAAGGRNSDLAAIFDFASQSSLFGRHAKDIVASDHQITVVVGSVGMGKTVLAAHWRRRQLEAGEAVELVLGSRLAEWVGAHADGVDHCVVIEDLNIYEGGVPAERLVAVLAKVPKVFVTTRPVPSSSPAFEVIAQLGRFQGAAVWKPSPLEQHDIEDMARALDPDNIDAVAAEHIARQVLQIVGGLPAASDLVLRSTLRHHRRIAPHRLIGTATAQAMVEYLGAEYQRLDPLAQRTVALLACTVGEVTLKEMFELVDKLSNKLGVENAPPSAVTTVLVGAQGAGLISPAPPDHFEAIGDAATWVVGQFDPELLAAACEVMEERSQARHDPLDQAFHLLLSHDAPSDKLSEACVRALMQLRDVGDHAEIVDFANQWLRDSRLARPTDPEVCLRVARIHLVAARAAESQGWRAVADHHWDRAFELGVRCGSDEAVGEAASAAGRFGRSETDSPTGRRLAAARAWAQRHASLDTRLLLEIEDQRRVAALGRHVPDERMEDLKSSLSKASPIVRADGWIAIAAVLFALPLKRVADQVEEALANVVDCLADIDDDAFQRPVADLAIHTLRAAQALRLADVDTADDEIERGHGAALYRRHPRRAWLALTQRATLAAIKGDNEGWRSAVEHAVTFGCEHGYSDAGAVGAGHLAFATHHELSLPELDQHVAELVAEPAKIDLGDARPHPTARLGVLALPGTEPNKVFFEKAWGDLGAQKSNVLTAPGLVYAAWAAQVVGATERYAEVAEALSAYEGEFVTLPVGVAPVAKVDQVLAELG